MEVCRLEAIAIRLEAEAPRTPISFPGKSAPPKRSKCWRPLAAFRGLRKVEKGTAASLKLVDVHCAF